MSDPPKKGGIDPHMLLAPGEDTGPRRRIGDTIPGEPEPRGYGSSAEGDLFANLRLVWRRQRNAQIQRLCTELDKYGEDPYEVLLIACRKAAAKPRKPRSSRAAEVPDINLTKKENAIHFSMYKALTALKKSVHDTAGLPSLEEAPTWIAACHIDILLKAMVLPREEAAETLEVFERSWSQPKLAGLLVRAREQRPSAWTLLQKEKLVPVDKEKKTAETEWKRLLQERAKNNPQT